MTPDQYASIVGLILILVLGYKLFVWLRDSVRLWEKPPEHGEGWNYYPPDRNFPKPPPV